MTDRFDDTTGGDSPADPALSDAFQDSAAFHDDVRRMLHRRAADVPAVRADGEPALGGDGRFTPAAGPVLGGASADPDRLGEVVDLPERDLGLRTTGSVSRGLPAAGGVHWTRRFGMVAAAAAVVVVAAVGLLSWRNQDRPVTVGSATPETGLLLLPPEGDEVELANLFVTPASDLVSPGDVIVGYAPDEAMITDGLIVLTEVVEDPSFSTFAGPDDVPVTAEQDPLLAELGAVIGPQAVSWNDPGDETTPARTVALFAYGDMLGDDDRLGLAGAVAPDPDRVLDDADLPAGWTFQVRLDDATVVSDAVYAELAGTIEGSLTSGSVALPLGLFGSLDEGDQTQVDEIALRGTTALLAVEGVEQEVSIVRLVWNEGGTNHQIRALGSVDRVVALAERLVPVDGATIQRRIDSIDPGRNEMAATTTFPATTATTGPPLTTVPVPGDLDPPFSMTAPGPGDVAPDGDGTPTNGTGSTVIGSTTTGPPTTGTGSTTTGPATTGPPPSPPETTVLVSRPNGSFTDNSIVPLPVAPPTLGVVPYEVGVSWSPRFGLCLGIDLDGDLTGGGYPVECSTEPWVGAGGSREIPGEGTIAFAFTFADPALASAELEVGGQRYEATIERLDAFTDIVFLLIPLPGVEKQEVDELFLPGEIVLRDGNGDSIGWG